MSSTIISPWDDHAEQISPNEKIKAEYMNGCEVAMGAPTLGELWLIYNNSKKEKISDNAGASFIWSDNSNYLAYSEWTKDKNQFVRIIKIDGMIDKYINKEMSVIQFESFENNILKGIDSPIYHPHSFSIDVNSLFE